MVEDDEGISNFIIKGLRESAYAVDLAVDGDDALHKNEDKKANQEHPE